MPLPKGAPFAKWWSSMSEVNQADAQTPAAETRDKYRRFLPIATRWSDNDIYGHLNNVVYYEFFDTAVNDFLIYEGKLDIHQSPSIAVVVETHCQYRRSISFPDLVEAGLRVARVGSTSVRFEIGIFRRGEAEVSAWGHFVHVFIDRVTRRPVPIPKGVRAALSKLVVEAPKA